ncbi:hypothetical protein LWC34_04150 [Kibdelosporangium philippinense]|uniref:DUF6545 domain-containing protein n=1 Tax=Kibdelosporangium philippinense TaxID=211113 RepID=A0ABS8Z2L2_9PSEU|nr:MAB_1171c family putative transporter [Kibdelosporangium philippinense]MCE7002025.1 hypothetical protein [Kibdelosporangium philippinense]
MTLEVFGIACMYVVTVLRAPQALRHRQQRALWFAMAAIAIAMTLRLDDVIAVLQHIVGNAHTVDVIRQLFATFDSAAVLYFVLSAAEYRRYQRWIFVLAPAVMAALLVLDVTAPPHTRNTVTLPGPPAAYWAIYFGFLFFTGVLSAVVCLRYSRRADRRPLRAGLFMFGLGMGLASVLWILFVTYLATGSQVALSLLSPVTGVEALCLAAGVALPAYGTITRPISDRTTFWRLWPLWRDMVGAVPKVALNEPRGRLADTIIALSVPVRLYRAVVEIRDAMLVLRHYLSPEDQQAAREHVAVQRTPDHLAEPAVTAYLIARSLRRRRSGDSPQEQPLAELTELGGDDVHAEIRFFRQVARFYRTSTPAA